MSCPPQLNTDIGGIGVRISFYLQALFLSCLSARSKSIEETTSSLYTFIATNVAMTVIAIIVGFNGNAQITLQDAIVVLYLLSLSSVAIFFSLVRFNRFPKSDATIKYLSIVQYYIFFGFALAVLIKASSGFGSQPLCNVDARVAIFRPFNFLPDGRTISIIALSIVIILYTVMIVLDYYPLWSQLWAKWRKPTQENASQKAHSVGKGPPAQDTAATTAATSTVPKLGGVGELKESREDNSVEEMKFDVGISGFMIFELFIISILWGLLVMNTELLIRWNNFSPSDQSQWQFGQILPLFLIVLPLINLVKAFKKHGLSRRRQRRRTRDPRAPNHA